MEVRMSSPLKDFKTAAKQRNAPDTVTFKVDDLDVTWSRPTEDQIIFLTTAQTEELHTESERSATLVHFALQLADEESRRVLLNRAIKPEYDFGFEDIITIVFGDAEDSEDSGLLGYWSRRPTKPFSDSTASQENGGASSTGIVIDVESTSSDLIQLQPAT